MDRLRQSRDRTPYAPGRGGGARPGSRGLQTGPPTRVRRPDGPSGGRATPPRASSEKGVKPVVAGWDQVTNKDATDVVDR
jgi:hypothetical protein